MYLSKLKKIRVYVTLVFLFITIIFFLDVTNLLPASFSSYVLYFQFIPSAIKFFNHFSLLATGFIVVLIVTLLFGRINCSSVCPLGTLQDIISKTSKYINKKKYFRLLNKYNSLKFSILVITAISLFTGSSILLNFLDPFSLTGKIFSNLFKFGVIPINNLVAIALEQFDIYRIYPIEIKAVSWLAVGFSASVLLIIGIMSFTKGRLFCNTICPLGTLLGLFSKLSLYKIAIDQNKCRGCNLCERVCKSGCIDKRNKLIDFERCVNCFNCFTVCPSGGIIYARSKSDSPILIGEEVDLEKRKFFNRLFIGVIGLSGFLKAQVKIIPKKESTVRIIKNVHSTPPGSKSVEHFLLNCTACHLCITTCPSQVLQPSFLEHGVLNILQPYMDNLTSYCTFDCIYCTEICPTGAILPLMLEEKKKTQIGKTNFVKENCIVETEGTACGACSERCPTKAVIMVPYKNLKIPEVRNEYCIGCGACEFACPTTPYKAIYVEGNPVHQIAKKAPIERFEQGIDYKEEFPF